MQRVVLRGPERSATVKKQSGINGLLPALRAGPFHLFRLLLDLRFDVLKKVTVTFPSEKVFFYRRPSGSQSCRPLNRRPIPRLIGSVYLSPPGSIFVSVVEKSGGPSRAALRP